MLQAGDVRGDVVVVTRSESAENLTKLSTKDVLVRRAVYDAIITARSGRYFEVLNRWLAATVPELAGIKSVLSIERYDLYGSDGVQYQCRVTLVEGSQETALLTALVGAQFLSVQPHFAVSSISLIISADALDRDFDTGGTGAVTMMKGGLPDNRPGVGGQLPGPEVAGVAAEVRGADDVELAAAAIVARIEDL